MILSASLDFFCVLFSIHLLEVDNHLLEKLCGRLYHCNLELGLTLY